jgi:hypothetical protein
MKIVWSTNSDRVDSRCFFHLCCIHSICGTSKKEWDCFGLKGDGWCQRIPAGRHHVLDISKTRMIGCDSCPSKSVRVEPAALMPKKRYRYDTVKTFFSNNDWVNVLAANTQRQKISFPPPTPPPRDFYAMTKSIWPHHNSEGAVILSTCGRPEIYNKVVAPTMKRHISHTMIG